MLFRSLLFCIFLSSIPLYIDMSPESERIPALKTEPFGLLRLLSPFCLFCPLDRPAGAAVPPACSGGRRGRKKGRFCWAASLLKKKILLNLELIDLQTCHCLGSPCLCTPTNGVRDIDLFCFVLFGFGFLIQGFSV